MSTESLSPVLQAQQRTGVASEEAEASSPPAKRQSTNVGLTGPSSLTVGAPSAGFSPPQVPSASSASSPSAHASASMDLTPPQPGSDAVPTPGLESGVASKEATPTTDKSAKPPSAAASASSSSSTAFSSTTDAASSTAAPTTTSSGSSAPSSSSSSSSSGSAPSSPPPDSVGRTPSAPAGPSSFRAATRAVASTGTCPEDICDGSHCDDPVTVEERAVEGTGTQTLAVVYWHAKPWVRASEVSKVVCNWRRTKLLDRLRQNPRRAHHVKSCLDKAVLSTLRVRSARVNLLDATNLRVILTSAGYDIENKIQLADGMLYGKPIRILSYEDREWVVANEAGLAIMGWPADYNTGLSKRLHHARGGHLMARCSDMTVLVKLGIPAPCVNLIAVSDIGPALAILGITISDDGSRLQTRMGAEYDWADGQWVPAAGTNNIPPSPATSIGGGSGPSTPRSAVKAARRGAVKAEGVRGKLAAGRSPAASPKTPGVKTSIRKGARGKQGLQGVDMEAAARAAAEIGAGALISLASPAATTTKRRSLSQASTPATASAAGPSGANPSSVTSLGGGHSDTEQAEAAGDQEFTVVHEPVELPTPSGPRRERMFVVRWREQRWLRVLDVEASMLIWSGGRVRSAYDGQVVVPEGPLLGEVLAKAGAAVPDGAPPVALTQVEEAGHVVCRLLQ